jgi:sugar/nucleoside kinase (ribokinase family)
MGEPDVVVVGAATRDLHDEDPRGWRLGGGVTFGALTLARLGVRIGVVLGLDEAASTAREIDLIRDAGAEVVEVPLERGPVFRNVETPAGRVQTCQSTSDPIPTDALPDAWRSARSWLLAPVAWEIPYTWTDVPPADACVALAWQGELRELANGARVRPKAPTASPFLARADILAFSRHDVPVAFDLVGLGAWLKARCEVLVTAGLDGGMLIRYRDGRIAGARAYASVPSRGEVDPVGAGDTMLAGLLACRVVAGPDGSRLGRDLRLGAAASSLLVEGAGMKTVPTLRQLRDRVRRSI